MSNVKNSLVFNIESNGKIVAGYMPMPLPFIGATQITNNGWGQGNVTHTFTKEELFDSDEGTILFVSLSGSGTSGLQINSAPAVDVGETLLYFNSNQDRASMNQTVFIAKVYPGTVFNENFLRRTSTYGYYHAAALYVLATQPTVI